MQRGKIIRVFIDSLFRNITRFFFLIKNIGNLIKSAGRFKEKSTQQQVTFNLLCLVVLCNSKVMRYMWSDFFLYINRGLKNWVHTLVARVHVIRDVTGDRGGCGKPSRVPTPCAAPSRPTYLSWLGRMWNTPPEHFYTRN